MKLKGVTTKSGNLEWWTGLPVGAALPWLVGKTWVPAIVAGWMSSKAMEERPVETAGMMASDITFANIVAMASPLALALPFLLFKKTRGAALGVIVGGVVSDTVYVFTKNLTSESEGISGPPAVRVL